MDNCFSLAHDLIRPGDYISVHWGMNSLPSTTSLPSFFWQTVLILIFLIPSYLLKVTKFLGKISQFEFLVMSKKNIFAYKLFLPLNISDFNL